MENNIDIIVLTSIVLVLFLVFIIATVRELNNMTTSDQDKKESGPRAEMLRLVGKLFTDERIDPVKRITFMNAIKPMMDDMAAEDEEKKKQ